MSDTHTSRYKHSTEMDKKVFLRILRTYKHVIENKATGTKSNHEKESAWKEIVIQFNESRLISHQVRIIDSMFNLFFH